MPDIYAGAKLFSALYVNTALLYIKRLGTESHSSLSSLCQLSSSTIAKIRRQTFEHIAISNVELNVDSLARH